MREPCGRSFDESLLSGYLDGALPQVDDQRVRIHLEDCLQCRALVAEMTRLREAAMSSAFKMPEDTQWSETPQTVASRLSRSVGWLLVGVWAVTVLAFGVWQAWRADEPLFGKLLAFGGLAGFVLLLLGVLLDRLKALETDRYREVRK